MRFLIISNAPIISINGKNAMYTPYLKEMILWSKYVDQIEFCCPVWKDDKKLLNKNIPDDFTKYTITQLEEFNIKSIKSILKSFFSTVKNLFVLFNAIKRADHIHLRCPGNVGLLACIIQIFFPKKRKTAKYAGNWDPNSKQPWSYKLQKWILNNTFLTKNMQVLVYGEWEGMSKNIKPFFTATYSEEEAIYANSLPDKYLPTQVVYPIRFMYVGTLSLGKRPLYALQLFQDILKQMPNCTLDVYGEGIMRTEVEVFITENRLQNKVILHGNQTKEIVEKAYQNNHFLILASQSEGWPKVVAEAMFWGCVPLSTNVSCVYQMMGYGTRGLLLQMNLIQDVQRILEIINDKNLYVNMSNEGKKWATQFTLNKFEHEIKKLLV